MAPCFIYSCAYCKDFLFVVAEGATSRCRSATSVVHTLFSLLSPKGPIPFFTWLGFVARLANAPSPARRNSERVSRSLTAVELKRLFLVPEAIEASHPLVHDLASPASCPVCPEQSYYIWACVLAPADDCGCSTNKESHSLMSPSTNRASRPNVGCVASC